MAKAETTPEPSILLIWDPMEVGRWQELKELDGWWIAGTVSTTRPGDRAVVYRTKRDQGIAGIFDFSTPAFRHDDLGWAAFGRPLPLGHEIPREALLRSSLGDVFRSPRGRRTLPPGAGDELARLLPRPLPWQAVDDDLPDLESEEWRWLPARGDAGWAVEGSMRDAIRAHKLSWHKLGFKRTPAREKRPPQSTLRMDLFEPGIVGECKLVGGLSTLAQLDSYLEIQRERSGRKKWQGHIIVAYGYSDPLARAVFKRADVRLWVCRCSDSDKPNLIEITDRRPMP